MSARVKCEVCGRSWHDSVAGECPLKPGRFICMYCCMTKCKNSYRIEGQIGQRCRAFDKIKQESARK